MFKTVRNRLKIWSWRQELNPRPADYKSRRNIPQKYNDFILLPNKILPRIQEDNSYLSLCFSTEWGG